MDLHFSGLHYRHWFRGANMLKRLAIVEHGKSFSVVLTDIQKHR